MKSYNLSFVISTRNRLPFLKVLFEHLLPHLQDDEEIVVVDGNSTDGSKEYLQELYHSKKIHQLISEPDKNQAHGWNKAFLMAKGIIIKKLIDDDVFCYDAIRKCKQYMLQNLSVDVVISNDLSCLLHDYKNIQKLTRLPQFEKWRKGLVPSFTFGDVHMLVRRGAFAYIGLYNTSYVMMDWEYSLRISYLKANIAYYTGYNALSVAHPQTVSALKNNILVEEQGKRALCFYEYSGDTADINYWSKLKILIGKTIGYSKNQTNHASEKESGDNDVTLIYNYLYQHISELNNSNKFVFYQYLPQN